MEQVCFQVYFHCKTVFACMSTVHDWILNIMHLIHNNIVYHLNVFFLVITKMNGVSHVFEAVNSQICDNFSFVIQTAIYQITSYCILA